LPEPDDVLLLIEVSDTTLRYDRQTKLPLYARVAIPEVWIVDLAARQIAAFRAPGAERGEYTQLTTYRLGESLAPAAFGDVNVIVADICGESD
jgi:Uma2 family endonuclease